MLANSLGRGGSTFWGLL